MSSNMNTILILGGTSGIGESFARRFHEQGKKLIITGRREARLAELKKELKGTETYAMDNTDLGAIKGHVETLFTKYPSIDTVWINGGIQYASSIKDLDSTSDEKVEQEVLTNVTAPMVLTRHIIPHLLARDSPATFMITSSGLAFGPAGALFPVYCATKAAIHQYMVGVRQSLKDTKVNVLTIVPPYVETALDKDHKDKLGGAKPMPLDQFTDEMFKILDATPAENLKEVAVGSAATRVEAWRSSIGAMLEQMGMGD